MGFPTFSEQIGFSARREAASCSHWMGEQKPALFWTKKQASSEKLGKLISYRRSLTHMNKIYVQNIF